MVRLVGRREHLGLVDVVDPERLEHLRLGEVADAGLGHDRDGDRRLDPLDERGVAHTGHAAIAADVGRHPLERHHRNRAGVLGDLGLLGVDHVHDHATLEHLGQAPLDTLGPVLRGLSHDAESIGRPTTTDPRFRAAHRACCGAWHLVLVLARSQEALAGFMGASGT